MFFESYSDHSVSTQRKLFHFPFVPLSLKKRKKLKAEVQEHVMYSQASHGILISCYLRDLSKWDKIEVQRI